MSTVTCFVSCENWPSDLSKLKDGHHAQVSVEARSGGKSLFWEVKQYLENNVWCGSYILATNSVNCFFNTYVENKIDSSLVKLISGETFCVFGTPSDMLDWLNKKTLLNKYTDDVKLVRTSQVLDDVDHSYLCIVNGRSSVLHCTETNVFHYAGTMQPSMFFVFKDSELCEDYYAALYKNVERKTLISSLYNLIVGQAEEK